MAKERIKEDTFPEADLAYAVIWRALLNIANDAPDGEVPSKGLQRKLEIEVARSLQADADVNEDIYTQIFGTEDDPNSGLIKWIFSFEEEDLDENEGIVLLKKYLHDQIVVRPLKEFVGGLGNRVPEDISEILRSVELKKQQIEAIGGVRAQPALTELYEPAPLPMSPTNVRFLDEYMDGGQADGEAYVLLGPSGVGKTTLGVQLACQGARYSQQLYRKTQDPKDLRHWYFFSYEQPLKPDIYHRVWSHLAEIHINTFRKGEELSTTGNLKPYEMELYKEQIAQNIRVSGEKQRLASIFKELDPLNLWLFDMSGFEDPNAGKGGVPEMVRVLEDEARAGKNIGGVVIDYAGLVVDRYVANNNISYDHIRHKLRTFVDEIRVTLTTRYNCPAWVLHQLAGAANKKSPIAKQHHSDAAECKTFADNASFAFSLGTKDDNNMCRISCTKSRRSAGTTQEKVIQIDGAFCTMRSPETQFVFDTSTNRIVPVSEQQQFAGPRSNNRGTARKPNPAAAMSADKALWPKARNVDFGDNDA